MQDLRSKAADKKDKENSVSAPSDEGELCPICYADVRSTLVSFIDRSNLHKVVVQVINTTFLPCRHQSCKRCIQRHMLQSKTCFFCKADITSLEAA